MMTAEATGLQAGREMDRLVAEKVMEWSDFWQEEPGAVWFGMDPTHTYYDDERLPLMPYSTDIAAAWEVVEKIRQQDHETQYRFVDRLYREALENDGLPKGGLMLLMVYVSPASICRAALKVVDAP